MMSAIAQWMNLREVEDDTHLNLNSTGIEQNCVLLKLEARTDISISKGDVNGPD